MKKYLFLLGFAFALFLFNQCKKDTDVNKEAESSNDEDDTSVHEDSSDYVWDASSVAHIVLNGSSITVDSDKATVTGSKVTITSAGNYSLSGSLTNGQVVVDTKDDGVVRLILNGASVTNTTGAPLFIDNAPKAIVIMAENTENTLTDGASYAATGDNDPNAALFSKSDMTLFGSGKLTVNANYKDGITSKDGLIIKSGTLNVISADDGIRGKDYLIVKGGNITVKSKGDGLTSDNDNNAALGYVSVDAGVFSVTSGSDAISGQTNVEIKGGEMVLTSGGGSAYAVASTLSAKGIKAGASLIVDKGIISISSADDGLHSNGTLAVNGGAVTIASGDDGIHAETSITIDGDNTIAITRSYEGIESGLITVGNGNVSIISSDDGFNASKGAGGEQDDGSWLYLKGGKISVNASRGDGLDSNGSIAISGGTIIDQGPQSQPEVGMDYNGTCNITGGILLVSGPNSGNMIQATSASSSQYALKITGSYSASVLYHIQDSNGGEVLTFKPIRSAYYIVFSSPALTSGSSYDIYTGGTTTGADFSGYYNGGTYSGGMLKKSFSISGKVTSVSF